METLRKGLLLLCMDLQPLCGPPATIRIDAAHGFSALANDDGLHQENLSTEIGRVKNPNKNPVAERAIQEVENELLREDPSGGAVKDPSSTIKAAQLI